MTYIYIYIRTDPITLPCSLARAGNKLVITGQEKTPIEISYGGVIIQRHDIATTHKEADNIIVQHTGCSR